MTVRVNFDSEKAFESPEQVTAEIIKLNEMTEEFEAAIDMLTTRIEELARMRRQMTGETPPGSSKNYLGE